MSTKRDRGAMSSYRGVESRQEVRARQGDVTPEEARLDGIRREHRHATATRRTEGDSWLNGYQDDVGYLLAERASLAAQLEAAQDVIEAAWLVAEARMYWEHYDESSQHAEERFRDALARYDAARGES